MFGIPGEVFWPTASFAAIVVLVFAGVAALRLLPSRKSRAVDQTEHNELLGDLQRRLDDLDQLTRRLAELEERVDFTERLVAQQRDGQRLAPPRD